MTESGQRSLTIREETWTELSRRKDRMKWKSRKPRPGLTWDEFLLEATEKYGEKHGGD